MASDVLPYGMRFVTEAPEASAVGPEVSYSEELQVLVTADGNPWQGVIKAETSSNTNSDSKDDEGTDMW